MVVGNGLIASVFLDYVDNKDYIIFASGVSSSASNSPEEFHREIDLIKKYINTESKFIYFSSTRIYLDLPYFNHKQSMEKFIIENFKNYIIFRLPNVIGKIGNKDNFFNYFKNKIIKSESIDVKDTYRALIDVEDLKKICEYCFSENKSILTISAIEKIKVVDIIRLISRTLNSDINMNFLEDSEIYNVENSLIVDKAIDKLIDKNNYTKKIIQKYI